LREVDALAAAHAQDAGLLTAAGAFLVRLDEPARGRALLERSIQLDPKSVLAHYTMARVAASSGDLLRVRTELGDILKIDPAHEGAHIAFAELAWRAGDRAAARKQLEEAVAAAPGAVEPRIRLAQLAFIDGDAARGKDLLDQAVQVATDRRVALLAAGRVLAAAGFTDEALARLQQASAAGLDDALLSAAQVQLSVGHVAEARQLVQTALEHKPGWHEAQGLLVNIDVRDGRLDRALAGARQLPRPTGMTVAEVDGDINLLAGKNDEAIKLYETAQRTTPSPALAIKLFNVRRSVQAPSPERSLTEWLEKKPQDATVRRVLAQHYQSAGRRDEALAQYERLAKEQGPDPAVLNNLAWMLEQSGDARALDIARRAHEAAPGVPEIADTYGWILVRSDKVAAGLAVLERALAAAPMNPDVQFHAAAAYAKNGENARAVELLRQCLQPGREFAARAEAEELLRTLKAKDS
jgi:putative PEP-CTERM system TPR-repeat lipoprotein